MTRRLFLAWRLGSGCRREIAAGMAGVIEDSAGVLRPVPHGSEHLTLLFLGERDVHPAELLSSLDPVRAIRAFPIRLGRAHVFPSSGRPRLVCVETGEGASELRALAESVRTSLEPLFADLVEYRFKPPHVTLARFRRGARRSDGRAVAAVLERTGVARWSAAERVETIELVSSRLSHKGAAYETLAEIALT